MDGIHDMGGMHGFGPIERKTDHVWSMEDWGARMYGIALSSTKPGGFSVDWTRHLMECIPPAAYLDCEYFDRWYRGDAANLVNGGWATLDELASGKAATVPPGLDPPLPPEAADQILHGGLDTKRPAAGTEAYSAGDAVRARMASPLGHTRLPRYVRGHVGKIEAFHGWHVFPDAAATGDDRAEPLYCVGFLARELWDNVTAPNDWVYADLWESYLDPA